MEKYLRKFTTKSEADRTHRLYDKDRKFYIGDKTIDIKNNNIEVDGEKYEGTPGPWELIVFKNPTNYTDEDEAKHTKLMIKTNAHYRENDPKTNRSKGNKGDKWKKILKPIWKKKKILRRKWGRCYSERS